MADLIWARNLINRLSFSGPSGRASMRCLITCGRGDIINLINFMKRTDSNVIRNIASTINNNENGDTNNISNISDILFSILS